MGAHGCGLGAGQAHVSEELSLSLSLLSSLLIKPTHLDSHWGSRVTTTTTRWRIAAGFGAGGAKRTLLWLKRERWVVLK